MNETMRCFGARVEDSTQLEVEHTEELSGFLAALVRMIL